jgi:hypothetical protein
LDDYATATSTGDASSIKIRAYQIIPEPVITFTRNSILYRTDEAEFDINFNISKDFYNAKKDEFNSLFTFRVNTPRLENVSFNIATETSTDGGLKDIVMYKVKYTRRVPFDFKGSENDIQGTFEIGYPSSKEKFTQDNDPTDDYQYSIVGD